MTATTIIKITFKDHEIELTTEEARALVVAIESAITPKRDLRDLLKIDEPYRDQLDQYLLPPGYPTQPSPGYPTQPSPGYPFGPPIICATQEP